MRCVNVTTINIAVIALLSGCTSVEIEDDPTSTAVAVGEMVLVPAGDFVMGSDEGQANERPKRRVHVDAFYIDKCEVTNWKYKDFLKFIEKTKDHSKCHPNEPQEKSHAPDPRFCDLSQYDMPVVGVDWYDAYAYAAWAGKRLPTEAEWEKAARGADGLKYPWGNDWSEDKCALSAIERVRANPYGKSPYGCYNMVGNAREWTATKYSVENLTYRDGDLPPIVSDISWLITLLRLTTAYPRQFAALRRAPQLEFQYRWEDGMLHRLDSIVGGDRGNMNKGKEEDSDLYTIKGGMIVTMFTSDWDMRASYRAPAMPSCRNKVTGFRCAMNP